MVDSKVVSILVATVILGPPQAAPMALGIMGEGLGGTLFLLAVGHLGSATFLLLFFELLEPLIARLRGFFGYLWLRLRGGEDAGKPATLSFQMMTPGSKYFFLGAVVFVFAFGSFLGVAATHAVGMRRWRAVAAVLLGCTVSVLFWSLAAYYLYQAIDPRLVTAIFLLLALGLISRGKILEHRFMAELRDLGAKGLRVLALLAYEMSPAKLAAETQIRGEEIVSILEELRRKGYVKSAGADLYRITSEGFYRLSQMPSWVLVSLGAREEEVEKDGDTEE